MSGGVDSSVAAALLKRAGHDVVGCFMRLGSPGDTLDTPLPDAACLPTKIHKQGCCSVGDANDARLVAAELDIPFYVCNFRRDFDRIIDYFVDEYAAGRTPNPCVRCNDWLKFGKLHDYARAIGATHVASGHHARIADRDGAPALLRGADRDKDQSYVLFGAPRDHLDRMLLPVGEMTKADVRALAERLSLPVFDKPDSQEICFVPDNDYAALVEQRRPDLAREGDILDTRGNLLGRHQGQHRFTIGQRRHVGVALGRPVYVVDKDPEANTVTIGDRDDLLASHCTGADANCLIDPVRLATWTPVLAQHRYNARPVPAAARLDADTLHVRFDEPTPAVAPGQAVVLYDPADPDRLIAGAWITDAD